VTEVAEPLPEVPEDVPYEHVETLPPDMETVVSSASLPVAHEPPVAPRKTSPEALAEAVEKLPPAVREGVLEALKGRFVGIIPAMETPDTASENDTLAPPPEAEEFEDADDD